MTHTPMGFENTARSVPRHPSTRRLHAVASSISSSMEISGPAWASLYRTRLQLSDAAIIVIALWPGFAQWIATAGSTTQASRYAFISVLVVSLWYSMLSVFRTRETRVLSVGVAEYKRVVRASYTTFGLLAITYLMAQAGTVALSTLLAFPIGLVALLTSRWLWRNWLARQGLTGHSLSRVVVVGQKDDVEYVVSQIATCSRAAYSVVGAVIDETGMVDDASGDAPSSLPPDLPVNSDLDGVAATAASLGADAVVVAGPPSSRAQFVRDLSWELEGTATDLILATGLANVAGPRIHLRPMEGLPLIHVEIPQFDGGKHVLKRAFDIAVSGTALLVLLPLMALIAMLVRLDSPGPAFFRQERVGRDGTSFTMFKFRSMVTTASDDLAALRAQNEGAGLLFKMKDDPRVTHLGRFLRKHSLDELPQLWNILLGDMSVVGPRPPLPEEVQGYEGHVHRRLYIRPGLTGMWQISGRSDLSWEESVKLDLYYVENWSLIGDLMIMWRTVRVLLSPVGAY